MARKVKVTTDNSGWTDPSKKKRVRKKRKPMSEEQKQAASERLAKARAARKPAKNESIHHSVLALDDDHVLSAKNVKSWIKSQKDLMSSLRYEVRKDVKGAKAKYHSAEGYIRHLKHYLKHGDYCDDYYGAYGEKKIKWQTITPKGM